MMYHTTRFSLESSQKTTRTALNTLMMCLRGENSFTGLFGVKIGGFNGTNVKNVQMKCSNVKQRFYIGSFQSF